MGETSIGLGLEREYEPSLAEKWMFELLDSGTHSLRPPRRSWFEGDEYAFYPFARRVTQAFAIGTDQPELVVCKTGAPLDKEQQTEIHDTYQWFYELIGSGAFDEPADVLIGAHLSPMFDMSLGRRRQRLGMYDGEFPRPLISINNAVFHRGLQLEKARYRPLLERGASLAEIVMTHELAHAVIQPYSPREESFAASAGWVINHYDVERDGESWETVTYRLDESPRSGPPTPYAAIDPSEDWPDSTDFYRFAPDLLDDYRYLGVGQVIRDSQHIYGERPENLSVRMVALPEPLYPAWSDF